MAIRVEKNPISCQVTAAFGSLDDVWAVAGLAALNRRFDLLGTLVSDVLFITVLGIAILLTGLMHMLGGFRTGEDASRERSWANIFMGVFKQLEDELEWTFVMIRFVTWGKLDYLSNIQSDFL